MLTTLIKNASIINEGKTFKGSVLIKGDLIEDIFYEQDDLPVADAIINGENHYLIAGVIDDQVHFREPGLTHKGNIASESAAAVSGGVTSFMDMPNTTPQTTNQEALAEKFNIAKSNSLANYSFYIGATNDNLNELLKTDIDKVCGVKVFMGSSTGNMLVNNKESLVNIFKEVPMLIATHCEDEEMIKKNIVKYKARFGENIPIEYHQKIRDSEACYKSSLLATELASKYNSRLHILHMSTKKELQLLNNKIAPEEKKITAEVCVHHLWFEESSYKTLGSRIKWNPAIKSNEDRQALREALKNNTLDIVATDHAPHTLEEKNNTYFKSPSGGPLVQHSLSAMLEMADQGVFTKELVIEKMCHAPARLFNIERRGFIRKGYYADLALIKYDSPTLITDKTTLYKCRWTPFTGETLSNRVSKTWVNGNIVYDEGKINSNVKGQCLKFNR
ncbi:dihydroorotase [Marinilabiliaceae bacterium ANBcel2]|nr:dihydroorotase [Marinilabiliaceae bacterium ANBcel2]